VILFVTVIITFSAIEGLDLQKNFCIGDIRHSSTSCFGKAADGRIIGQYQHPCNREPICPNGMSTEPPDFPVACINCLLILIVSPFAFSSENSREQQYDDQNYYDNPDPVRAEPAAKEPASIIFCHIMHSFQISELFYSTMLVSVLE